MIESLHGIQETVNFKENTTLRLYDNIECENYPPHWHGPLEIVMPLHGCYGAVCSGIRYQLREGDVLLINPGVIHSLEAPPVGERLIFQADCSLFRHVAELNATLSILSPALLITAQDIPASHEKLVRLMLSIQEEYFADAPMAEALIYSRLIEMFVLIGREFSPGAHCLGESVSKQKEYTEKFLYICNYIEAHCTEAFSLEDAAKLAGFSKYHFSRLFKCFTNVSFYKYLNQKRIAYAETLLIHPELSVTEVALRCGYESLSSFIRMFKIVKNCTPTEFKSMYSP